MARKAALMMSKKKLEKGLANLIDNLTTHQYEVEIEELCNAGTELRLCFLLRKKDGSPLLGRQSR